MRRLLPLALLLPACTPAAMGPAPAAPFAAAPPVPVLVAAAEPSMTTPAGGPSVAAPVAAPGAAAGPAAPTLGALSVTGQAERFGAPFGGATVRLYALGSEHVLATATADARGDFTLTLPARMPADTVLKLVATRGTEALVTVEELPGAFALQADAPRFVLDVARTTSYALLAKRLEAAGIVKGNGAAARAAVMAFKKLADSLKGAIRPDDTGLVAPLLAADEAGQLTLSQPTLNMLGARLDETQRSAFTEASVNLAKALRTAMAEPGAVRPPRDLLAGISLGGTRVPGVTTTNGRRHLPPPPNPIDVSVGLVLGDAAYLPPEGPEAVSVRYSQAVAAGPTDIALSTVTGDAWVASSSAGVVSRVSRTGVVRTFTVGSPAGVAVDSLGNAWISNASADTVTRIDADGVQTSVAVGDRPGLVVAATDGSVWVLCAGDRTVVRIPSAGPPVSASVGQDPVALAVGGSGTAWIVNRDDDAVTRVTSTGVATTVPVGDGPAAVAVAADGTAWVANRTAGTVTRIPTVGDAATTPVGALPSAIAVAADGAAWVASTLSETVTRVPVAGEPVPYAVAAPRALTVDDAGAAWITGGDGVLHRIAAAGTRSARRVGGDPLDVVVDTHAGWVLSGTDALLDVVFRDEL